MARNLTWNSKRECLSETLCQSAGAGAGPGGRVGGGQGLALLLMNANASILNGSGRREINQLTLPNLIPPR